MGNMQWRKTHKYKIEAMTNMEPPTTQKEVQKFIGVVHYYRNIWPMRSHTLTPLTRLNSTKQKFKWKEVEQDTFNEIKWIVARDTLLIYPDFDKKIKLTPMLRQTD